MKYERPDGGALKKELAALAEKLDKAEDYGAAKDAFLRIEELSADFSTLSTLVLGRPLAPSSSLLCTEVRPRG